MQHLPFEFDLDLIRRLDRTGPRYTSYPTADRLTPAFGARAYQSWVARRNIGGVRRALSLYLHLPFCSTLCFYCACNKIATKNRNKGARYLDYLYREIGLQSALLGGERRVEQMHWGGGTPTFYDMTQLGALFERLRSSFDFDAEGEYSIEVDPRTVDAAGIGALRRMGFNRISLGVQDFDPEVQHAVNRVQSEPQTLAVIEAARREQFHSISTGIPRMRRAICSAWVCHPSVRLARPAVRTIAISMRTTAPSTAVNWRWRAASN